MLWSVSRFRCRSDLYEMDLLIDINVDVYPMEVGLQLLFRLCTCAFIWSDTCTPHATCRSYARLLALGLACSTPELTG